MLKKEYYGKFSIEDFQTGVEWNTPCKRLMWEDIANENGGWKCLESLKSELMKKGGKSKWMNYPIRGITEKMDFLTGKKYPKNQIKCQAQTLSYQFKCKFDNIKAYMVTSEYNESAITKALNEIIKVEETQKTKFDVIKEILQKFSASEVKDIANSLSSATLWGVHWALPCTFFRGRITE